MTQRDRDRAARWCGRCEDAHLTYPPAGPASSSAKNPRREPAGPGSTIEHRPPTRRASFASSRSLPSGTANRRHGCGRCRSRLRMCEVLPLQLLAWRLVVREAVPMQATVPDAAKAQATYDSLLKIPCYADSGSCPMGCGHHNVVFTFCDGATLEARLQVCGCNYVYIEGACQGSTSRDRALLDVLADALGVDGPCEGLLTARRAPVGSRAGAVA